MSKYLLAFLTLWLLPFNLDAQEKSLKLDEIIKNYIQALGGLKQLQAVTSMKMTGLHTFRGWEYPLTIMRMQPNFYRVEIDYGDRKEVSAFGGEIVWKTEDDDRSAAREMQDPGHLVFMEMNADFQSTLMEYKAKGHQVELAGTENVDGKEAYKLKVTLNNRRIEDWFIDRISFLLLKRTTTFNRRDRELSQTLYFMDYKKVNGLMIPHYIERLYDPHYVLGYEIQEVKFNPELDSNLFKMPKKETRE